MEVEQVLKFVLVCVVCMGIHSACVEVRGQLMGVGFLLPHGVRGSN